MLARLSGLSLPWILTWPGTNKKGTHFSLDLCTDTSYCLHTTSLKFLSTLTESPRMQTWVALGLQPFHRFRYYHGLHVHAASSYNNVSNSSLTVSHPHSRKSRCTAQIAHENYMKTSVPVESLLINAFASEIGATECS